MKEFYTTLLFLSCITVFSSWLPKKQPQSEHDNYYYFLFKSYHNNVDKRRESFYNNNWSGTRGTSTAKTTFVMGLGLTIVPTRTVRHVPCWFTSCVNGCGGDKQFTTTRRATRGLFSKAASDDEDDDIDDDEDDDYEVEDKRIIEQKRQQLINTPTYGFNRGRSSPSQRKAMGTSSTEQTLIHVCTHCGSESIKWYGQCPTCREWNTIQPMKVQRDTFVGKPTFASQRDITERRGRQSRRTFNDDEENDFYEDSGSTSRSNKSSSWLRGVGVNNNYHDHFEAYSAHTPRSIRHIHDQMKRDHRQRTSTGTEDVDDKMFYDLTNLERRLIVPNHFELNRVLGGGLMPGSLTLLGGDPGVGKSTLLLQIAAAVSSLSSTPGIGMGTSSNVSNNSKIVGPAWYVSGEENSWQIAARAARLGLDGTSSSSPKTKHSRQSTSLDHLMLLCDTDADYVADLIANAGTGSSSSYNPFDDETTASSQQVPPSLVVIDSIQTMLCDAGNNSAPGGVTQVRETVNLFLRLAKSTGIPIIMIGHVTKTGDVAGPRTVEHMVDCVLYLEHGSNGGNEYAGGTGGDDGSGSSSSNIRLLRASKNRFGSSDEIGVYQVIQEMDEYGDPSTTMDDTTSPRLGGGALVSVMDPSSLFLQSRFDDRDLEGCAVSIILEGSRCMAAEVQALVGGASGGYGSRGRGGRRTVDGVSLSRVLLILAVLEKRFNIYGFQQCDVYVNVVGGIRLNGRKNGGFGGSTSGGGGGGDRYSSDLAIAIALVSSFVDISVRSDTAFVGEIGLVGELRPSPTSLGKRIREAQRMGFSRIVVPASTKNKQKKKQKTSSSTSNSYMINNIQVIECDTLLNAINEGLVMKLYPDALRNRRRAAASKKRQTRKYNDDDDDNDEEDDFYIDDDDDDDYHTDEQDEMILFPKKRKRKQNQSTPSLSNSQQRRQRLIAKMKQKKDGPWRDVEELFDSKSDDDADDTTDSTIKKSDLSPQEETNDDDGDENGFQ